MIGLLDIDSKMPNVALMKLKTYYGNNAKMITPLEAWSCEKVYASKLFYFTELPNLPDNTEIGGTGYDIKKRLPDEIEQCQPDYSIYNNINLKTRYAFKDVPPVSMQRYSTGCIRRCPFCVVYEKEGGISPASPMNLNPKGKWIYIYDNNFFSSPAWLESIKHLISCNQPVVFEGLDARIITDEQLHWLNKVKIKKQLHFAWDNPKDDLMPQLKKIVSVVNKSKVMVYVLIGYWSTPEQDLYRVEKLRELKIDPFVMPFDKNNPYQKRFARWVNHKAIFKTVKWNEYR